MRVAIVFSPLPLAVFALVLARRRRWRHPLIVGAASLALYLFALFPMSSAAAALIVRGSSVPPALLAWLPNLALLVLAGALGGWRSRDDRVRLSPEH